jgi:2'-5' RNA ligase
MAGHRLFFALAPPPAVCAQLERATHALASSPRVTAGERLHVTLAFLGDFPEASDAPARAMAAAGRTRGESFALVIDQAASFGPTWFLGSSCPPVELAALHASLTAELAGEGFALERRAFHPHLTFLRKAGSALPATPITPIAWHAEDFLLFDSRSTEQRYVELGRWKLGTQ